MKVTKPDDADARHDRAQDRRHAVPPDFGGGAGRGGGAGTGSEHGADGDRLTVCGFQRVGRRRHHRRREPGDRRDGVALRPERRRRSAPPRLAAGRTSSSVTDTTPRSRRPRVGARFARSARVGRRGRRPASSSERRTPAARLGLLRRSCPPSQRRRSPDGADAKRLGDGAASECPRGVGGARVLGVDPQPSTRRPRSRL